MRGRRGVEPVTVMLLSGVAVVAGLGGAFASGLLRWPADWNVASAFTAFSLPGSRPAEAPGAQAGAAAAAPAAAADFHLTGAPQSFRDFLAAAPESAARFEALKAFLAAEGVGDVLPAWQLLQVETTAEATRCAIAQFAFPPEAQWPQIVPALQIVRERIVPAVGPVRILSGYRTPEGNACALGAEGSAHTRFAALDLQAVNPVPQAEMFATLCRTWYETPAERGFGLGAYYTRTAPDMNAEGRFHVDGLGRRTWGHSYEAWTSHCRELRYITAQSPEQKKAADEARKKAEDDARARAAEDARVRAAAASGAEAESAGDAAAEPRRVIIAPVGQAPAPVEEPPASEPPPPAPGSDSPAQPGG